jgi:hypothetical protein
MSEKMHDVILKTEDQLAVLSKEFHLHLLNCSSSGCLVEMRSPIEVGTIGTLRLVVDGNPFSEDVQVVRCQQIEGAGWVYHVGADSCGSHRPTPDPPPRHGRQADGGGTTAAYQRSRSRPRSCRRPNFRSGFPALKVTKFLKQVDWEGSKPKSPN